MIKLKSISESLETTLKESELHNVTSNIAESIGDSFLNDGILKDIPIIGTIIGLRKSAINIRDQLFLKKLILFISKLSKISKEERLKQINKIESSNEYKTKVGEKLLYIIDKCDDDIKAEIIGELFNSYLKTKITYTEFLKCSNIVNNLFINDINYFLNNNIQSLEIDLASQFINTGLMKIVFTQPKMVDISAIDFKPSGTNFELRQGKTEAHITELGKIFKKGLSNN